MTRKIPPSTPIKLSPGYAETEMGEKEFIIRITVPYVLLPAESTSYMRSGDPQFLSPRQKEVLALVRDRLTNKEIAARLNISERTVKFHVSALLAEFGVPKRTGLL